MGEIHRVACVSFRRVVSVHEGQPPSALRARAEPHRLWRRSSSQCRSIGSTSAKSGTVALRNLITLALAGTTSSPYLDSPVNRIQLSCVVVHRIFSAGLIGPLLVMADRLHPYLRPRKWNHIVPGHDENSRTGRLSWLRPQRARAAIGVFPRRSDRCAIKRRSCSQAEVMFGSTVRPLCSGPDSPNRVSRRPICVGPVCSLEQRLPCWTRVVGGH